MEKARRVVASLRRGFTSVVNFETMERFGVEGFIPFKTNAVINPKSEAWSSALCKFLFQQEHFLPHYHRRSNVETVMWMIKSKFGASVSSRRPVAQVNEVLCKCLAHNLCCLVRAIFASGLAPEFWKDAPTTPTLALVQP